jgi:hypothetical protein
MALSEVEGPRCHSPKIDAHSDGATRHQAIREELPATVGWRRLGSIETLPSAGSGGRRGACPAPARLCCAVARSGPGVVRSGSGSGRRVLLGVRVAAALWSSDGRPRHLMGHASTWGIAPRSRFRRCPAAPDLECHAVVRARSAPMAGLAHVHREHAPGPCPGQALACDSGVHGGVANRICSSRKRLPFDCCVSSNPSSNSTR